MANHQADLTNAQPGEPENPYVVGNAVFQDGKFFDRTDIIEWIIKALRSTHNNALVLIGQRRIGKTSLLRRLERLLPDAGHRSVYFDLQDEGRRPLGEVLAELAEEMADQLGQEPPAPENFDDRGKYFSRNFLPGLVTKMAPSSRLVVLVDEFEAVDPGEESDLPKSSAAHTLQPFLRKLIRDESQVAFVFAMGRSTEELTRNVKATFKSAQQRKLWVLDETSAKQVVLQAQIAGSLRFTPEGVQRILDLAGGHPYLTQLLCASVWDLSYEGVKSVLPPPVGAQEVELAIDRALETGGGALEWLWDGLAPAEKIYAAALAGIARQGEKTAGDRVLAAISQHAPQRRSPEILRAAADLVNRGILRESRDEHFTFEFELFRQWVEREKPLRVVEDELDLLKPEAEAIYLLGRKVLRKKEEDPQDAREQLRHACDYFHRVLEINPEHFKAQLALGETLLQLGARRRALEALEAAHTLSPKKARLILVGALVENAEVAHSGGDEHLALKLVNRALELSPLEATAKHIQSAIWTAWGDRAQDEEEKLHWYHKAGKTEKAAAIKKRQYQRRRQFEPITQAMRTTIDAADEVTISCQQAALATNEKQQRGIWNAAGMLSWEERRMLLHLAKGIDGLKKMRIPWAETHLAKVKPSLPEDESERIREISQSEPEVFSTREAVRGSRPDRYRLHEQAALRNVQKLAQALITGRSEAESLAATETWREALPLWTRALELFQEKTAATRSYFEGIQALQKGHLDDAQRKLGWRLELPPSPPEHEPSPADDSGLWLAKSKQQENQVAATPPMGVPAVSPPPTTVAEEADQGRVIALDFSSDGQWLASACGEGVNIWSPKSRTRVHRLGTREMVEGSAFSAESTMLAVLLADSTVRVYSLAERKVIQKLEFPPTVVSVAFSPVRKMLALGAQNGSITFWDLEKVGLSTFQTNGGEPVRCLAFSPDGKLLAAGSAAAEVHVWRVADGSCVHSLVGAGGAVDDVIFSADGSTLAAAFADSVVRVWAAGSGECRYELLGHSSAVRGVAFHCEGYLLASGSLDGTVRLWRLADGELLDTLEDPDGGVTAVRFSPNGKLLTWGTSVGNVWLWPTMGEDPPVKLTA